MKFTKHNFIEFFTLKHRSYVKTCENCQQKWLTVFDIVLYLFILGIQI